MRKVAEFITRGYTVRTAVVIHVAGAIAVAVGIVFASPAVTALGIVAVVLA